MEEEDLLTIVSAILWAGDKANLTKVGDEYIDCYAGDAYNLREHVRAELAEEEVGDVPAEDRAQTQLAAVLLAAEGSDEVIRVHRGDFSWSPTLDLVRELRRDYDAARAGKPDVE